MVETDVPPMVVAVRDVTSTGWRGVSTAGTHTFDLVVAGPYQIVVVCGPAFDGAVFDDAVLVAVYARSPSDLPLLQHTCSARALPTFTVSGTMVNPGQINLGYVEDSSTTSNWSFSLHPEVGSYDLVLLQQNSVDPPRIALRRDLEVTGDLDLGTLDVAQEPGHALVEISFAVPSLQPGEQLSSGLELRTGTTTASLPAFLVFPLGHNAPPSWSMSLVPDAALRASDRQIALLAAYTLSTSEGILYERIRSVARDMHVGDTVPWSLPEPIGPVAFEMAAHRVTVAWSSLVDYSDIFLSFSSRPADHSLGPAHELILSRAYIEDVGTTGATLDVTGVPGIPPEWQIDPARWSSLELDVIRGEPGETREEWTLLEGPVSQPAPKAGPGVAQTRSVAGRRWPHGWDR
jgi:hypothetical protein